MLSKSSHLNVMTGDSVLLPCYVSNIGRNVRMWKHLPSTILFSGNIAVSGDPKLTLVNESSLHIERVTPHYAGDYVCQISRHPFVNVVHKIQVFVPPSVVPDPDHGEVIIKKGESVTLKCKTSGIPKPQVSWTHGVGDSKSSVLPSGVDHVHGWKLHISSVDIFHAGRYECVANNEVGPPATASFLLTVYYTPEVMVRPEWVHGDQGVSVEFVCTCRSAPTAQVAWLQGDHKNGKPLRPSERIRLKERVPGPSAVEVILKMQKIRREELGSYTCVARNSVGQTWKTVEISGLAEPIQIRGNESGENSFLLLWTAKSYSPIIEYQLKIRKHKSGTDWTDVMIPAAEDGGGQHSLLYSQSYNVTGLEVGQRYEAVLQAHNEFGFNRPSETFIFGIGDLVTSNYEMEEPVQASLLPMYDAVLDVTDPPHLEQAPRLSSYPSSAIQKEMIIFCLFLLLFSFM
ncbi:MAM domain-containing glycosylphosphatidylinositol anchor protein 1-like [Uloborus diversus]|uniref:MAM domain-containing glycosylphosphatidylinositol anchor protein 1-like n=1 Tax=Uloborus diversus TaxID=327109 RepID=UPI00240A2DD4|nr:MAM domain-containing glycosylphosphatidylinositol anchor protein 1-like [Uloborus diversus]